MLRRSLRTSLSDAVPVACSPRLVAAAVFLAACGSPELDSLEERQVELRDQLDDLRSEVGRLNDEMVEAGLMRARAGRPGAGGDAETSEPVDGDDEDGAGAEGEGEGTGRKPGGHGLPLGNPDPEHLLDLELTAERRGTRPKLPKVLNVERGESACGFRFMARSLQVISDFPLNAGGYGKSSPVQMFENGKPLTPHAMPADYEERCGGAFRHAGNVILFSPTGSVEVAETAEYTLELAGEVPLPRGDDGRPMYWVYPGTVLTFHFGKGWDDAWGKMMITLGGKVATKKSQWPATITFPGGSEETSTGKPPIFVVESKIDEPPRGPWSIEISSPDGGPYLLVDVLTIGNREHAAVVTSDKAFRTEQDGR